MYQSALDSEFILYICVCVYVIFKPLEEINKIIFFFFLKNQQDNELIIMVYGLWKEVLLNFFFFLERIIIN